MAKHEIPRTPAGILEWAGRSGVWPNYVTETDGRPRCLHSDSPCGGCVDDSEIAVYLARAVRIARIIELQAADDDSFWQTACRATLERAATVAL